MMPRPFLLAMGLLTRIPAPWHGPPPTPVQMGRSLLYYPLVGLLLGGILTLLALILHARTPPQVEAALILITWVGLTGGLHLDGLADTADGWIGGMGDREKTLAIMQDPYCGPAGVVAVVLLLGLKFATLQALLPAYPPTFLLIPLLIGRASLLALFIHLPYVRANGMGATAANAVSAPAGLLVLLTCGIFLLVVWPAMGLRVVVVGVAVWYLLQNTWMRRLGGTTGDTAGATCEIMEAAILTSMTFLFQ